MMTGGANICITNNLARIAGLVAAKHPDCSVQIEWRDTEDESIWFLTASDGTSDHVYLADDERGAWMPMNRDELARYDAGVTVFADPVLS